MPYAIYIVTNLVNAKQYVGISKNLGHRFARHKRANGENPLLHRAIKKYGAENFAFTHIADAFTKEFAHQLEQMLIIQHNTKFPNGYNLTDGGETGVGRKNGLKHLETTKEKISNSLKGKTSPRKGVVLSNETKKKISEAKKGKASKREGYRHTVETIEKIRAKKLARDLISKIRSIENV